MRDFDTPFSSKPPAIQSWAEKVNSDETKHQEDLSNLQNKLKWFGVATLAVLLAMFFIPPTPAGKAAALILAGAFMIGTLAVFFKDIVDYVDNWGWDDHMALGAIIATGVGVAAVWAMFALRSKEWMQAAREAVLKKLGFIKDTGAATGTPVSGQPGVADIPSSMPGSTLPNVGGGYSGPGGPGGLGA